jgi:acetyl esterase/lipase
MLSKYPNPNRTKTPNMRTLFLNILTLFLLTCTIALSQEPTVEYLWPNGAPDAKGDSAGDKPTLTFFFPEKPNGAAIVICPGGAYRGLAATYEGDEVARWCNTFGVTGIVLRYRHARSGAGYKHPTPLLDAQHALSLVRCRARELGIDSNKIGILGFSAGGHLAASLGTHFTPKDRSALDPLNGVSCRPDFMILIYPVITMDSTFTNRASRESLLGLNPAQEVVDLMSNEKQVTPDSPPGFIVHTTDDQAVPVENAVAMYTALRKADVPAEMHIFQHGAHGFGLGFNKGAVEAWPELCKTWMKNRGLIP